MILAFFKKSYFTQVSGVVFFAMLMAIPDFLQTQTEYIPQTTLFLKQFPLQGWWQINWLYQIINNLLLLALAFYIKHILSKHELINRRNFLSSILVIALFNFLHPFQFQLISVLNVFLLSFSLHYLLQSFEDEHPDNSIFSASLLISFASLFSYSNFIFFPFIWISFFVFQNYSIRYLPITIIGLLSPYLFFFTWLFWFNDLNIIIAEWNFINKSFFQVLQIHGILQIIIFSILGFFAFISLSKILPEVPSKIIAIRQKTTLSLWLLVFSFYPLVFFPDLVSNNFFIIAYAGLLAYYLTTLKNKRLWIDLLFTIFVILLIINKYYYASEIFLK